jgi:hypothetical protein
MNLHEMKDKEGGELQVALATASGRTLQRISKYTLWSELSWVMVLGCVIALFFL